VQQSSLKNLLIGLFFLSGMTVIVCLVLFLRPSVGNEKQTLYVRFANINKISIGTRVLFAGKAIGEVTAIVPIYHARETQPTDSLGRLYFYQLTLKIDSTVAVYSTDEIVIHTAGLLGERSISIVPKAPPTGTTPIQITQATPFYADSIDPIENTFNRLSDIGQKLEDTVDLVKGWFEENREMLSHGIASFGSAVEQVDLAAKTLNEQELIPQMKRGAEKFTSSLGKMDVALAQMEHDNLFANLGETVESLKGTSHSLQKVSDDIVQGRGTVGRLFQGDDLYLRMNAILSKGDTLMNDVNHYGVLFHLNKSWQRLRTKRISEVTALANASDFKAYFQGEVDKISTSMARLSVVISRAGESSDDVLALKTSEFRDNFAELMRKVDEMSSMLRLYNEQLSAAPVQE
jgi:phospholipid/cholesterol/gamma-HCH transport system substrate-binding protein